MKAMIPISPRYGNKKKEDMFNWAYLLFFAKKVIKRWLAELVFQ